MQLRKQYALVRRYPVRYLLGILTLCLFLLSGCGTLNNASANNSMATAVPTPTIDPTLKNQGDMQLKAFQQWITLMQQYGGDVTTYQQQYNADQQALQNAHTKESYQTALTTLNKQVDAIKFPAMKAEGTSLQKELQQQVSDWGQTHKYHDSFNNTDYPLGYEYGSNGIGDWVNQDLTTAKTMADYQQAIENLQMYLTNFQAMKDDSNDKTPYNQVHQTDLQLLQHYNRMDTKVVIVSLSEQALRVYDHGKLVNAFLVTTGRPDKPSIPGTWWVEGKQAPTVFKAGVPQSSPYWYPDTPINYAMQYHSDGYYLHDSWWRNDYGPGTNFPHADSSGDPFSAQGSHGCVNMSKDNAAWLYNFVKVYTRIFIY